MKIYVKDSTATGKYRPMTLLSAIDNAVGKMKDGDRIVIESVIDLLGNEVPVPNVRVVINKISDGKKFVTRVVDDGLLVLRAA